jgi:hypothetical protein
MADRPILFSGPMVRALLDGRKTQTRRVVTPQPFIDRMGNLCSPSKSGRTTCWGQGLDGRPYWHHFMNKYVRFAAGDRLYVREAWRTGLAYEDISPAAMGGEEQVLFVADGGTERWSKTSSEAGRLRQGMHMPRWASRLTLNVTDVRVQRLQDISEVDAIAEGVECWSEPGLVSWRVDDALSFVGAVDAYRLLWDSLNAGRGYGWEANPWIVAYSFTVQHGNIDQIGRAA